MTSNQAINYMINTSPILYASPSLYESKMRCYDYIFNVIGNGINDIKSFQDMFSINMKNATLIESYAPKYVGNKDLFLAYREYKDFGHGIKMGVHESVLDGLYTSGELDVLQDVNHSMKIDKNRSVLGFVPYPNFNERYSFVWCVDIKDLDKTWILAAKEYYDNCKDFFNSNAKYLYSGAWTDDEKEINKQVTQYELMFKKYYVDGMNITDINKSITGAYGVAYDGNIKKFIMFRWDIELKRIFKFIDDTLLKLNEELNFRNNSKPTKNKM